MPSKVSFPLTTFNDLEGNVLSNGYIYLKLSKDTLSPVGQICGNNSVKILLDSNGVLVGNPQFWKNSDLQPNDSSYILTIFTSTGQQVGKVQKVTI